MQDLMTDTIIAVALLFTAVTVTDFAVGLVKTWRSAGAKAQSPAQSIAAIERPAAQDQVVEFQGESAFALSNP